MNFVSGKHSFWLNHIGSAMLNLEEIHFFFFDSSFSEKTPSEDFRNKIATIITMITGNNKNSFLFMHAICFSKISHILYLVDQSICTCLKIHIGLPFSLGFPAVSAGKESACNAGDLGSIPGLGRSPGEGNSNPLQYSGLENSTDCIVHGVAKSLTPPSDFHFTSLYLKQYLVSASHNWTG